MPFGLFEAHWQQMPRISAVEAIQAFDRGVVAGSVRLREREPQRILRAWQRMARGPRRRGRRVATQADRIEALRAMGIDVVLEGTPE